MPSIQELRNGLVVADYPPEMHVASKQGLQTLVVALEREF